MIYILFELFYEQVETSYDITDFMSTSGNINIMCKMNQAAFFVFQALKLKVYVFQTKGNELCRQKVHLNPSLVLYSGSCESSNMRTNSARNFQLVLS